VRRRLDAELVRRGLFPSREKAQQAITDHRVLVSGSVAERAARQVAASEPIELRGEPPRFVSRGGEKLDAALDRFGIVVEGLDVFDAGASTGGFTDCLLQRGAASVLAVDVGIGQMHERLRAHARVEVRERVNLRTVSVSDLAGDRRFPLLVGDLSFISLTSVAPNLVELLNGDGQMVLLVKPQFEAGRVDVAKGRGVIRDPAIWLSTLDSVVSAFCHRGLAMMSVMPSPITGADGNVEFLVHFRQLAAARVVAAPSKVAEGSLRPGPLHDAVSEARVREGLL
jgi:23S rRNA (cytidine1920-2'-O)/16S rRNA (cytidine1409-2'-O)-methyltransferase